MDPWSPIHDWHSQVAAKQWTRSMRWRARWQAVRYYGYPLGIALALLALWLMHRL